ncbi:hypothetical protein CD30_14040 [Ureibacillus massiliensis 4400831 = CIP 108448 = CCUG 49529]|uniref:CBS domain-containing protein n=1 Tax=Ureibacillus massiliensis 4400831 = CIP 108448 = CCUG 49529 TaxID=1211035 RepID=A0A0A3J2Q2_9BACL|nr:DUF294 nucleotidyltransferase-like domain-containing protein [Ureibacillus massiliensis]KGR90010.1 hypothetical protein CD30_14040 [Ureibacillus massiliensis 4400831 = CIP 108448 = CCUG 49529]
METYESIRQWKNQYISSYIDTSVSLNDFHDQVMLKVLEVAKGKMKMDSPPCSFSWFITGSGGRLEQGLISDQDHGIVYEVSNQINDLYFKELGEEIAFGLDFVGYPYCNGNIMSSNPIWCKSLKDWETQLVDWMENESWEVIRYLQIFFDARVLFGNTYYIHHLKSVIFDFKQHHPKILKRFAANMKHAKNVIGPFGQIIVEPHGVYQGCINLKYSAFIPYVNSIRLLSIKENIYETSTLDRMGKLVKKEEYTSLLKNCEGHFSNLIKYRMSLLNASTYDDTHYLNIKNLSKEQRKEIKQILKDGKRLHDAVISMNFIG